MLLSELELNYQSLTCAHACGWHMCWGVKNMISLSEITNNLFFPPRKFG